MKGDLLGAVTALVDEYDMCPAGGTVLCAVSGGADSMCLLHLLLSLGKWRGFSVQAAHFNHHLRGEASDADQRFVEDWCRAHGVPCLIGANGVEKVIELPLTDEEMREFHACCDGIRKNMEHLSEI